MGLREEGGVLVVHIRFAGLATHAAPVLVRSAAASVPNALGPQSPGAEVRVQLCTIAAGPELPRVVDAIQDT